MEHLVILALVCGVGWSLFCIWRLQKALDKVTERLDSMTKEMAKMSSEMSILSAKLERFRKVA